MSKRSSMNHQKALDKLPEFIILAFALLIIYACWLSFMPPFFFQGYCFTERFLQDYMCASLNHSNGPLMPFHIFYHFVTTVDTQITHGPFWNHEVNIILCLFWFRFFSTLCSMVSLGRGMLVTSHITGPHPHLFKPSVCELQPIKRKLA